MARVLVSLSDVAAAVGALSSVSLDGEPHVDATVLYEAIAVLTGQPTSDQQTHQRHLDLSTARRFAFARDLSAQTIPPPPELSDADARIISAGGTIDHTLEQERAQLAALPPGPCSACGRSAPHPREHVHPGGQCGAEGCSCDDYVDMTVRDPVQARLERRGQGIAPGAPAIMPEPETGAQELFMRPPSNHNEFRRPSAPADAGVDL